VCFRLPFLFVVTTFIRSRFVLSHSRWAGSLPGYHTLVCCSQHFQFRPLFIIFSLRSLALVLFSLFPSVFDLVCSLANAGSTLAAALPLCSLALQHSLCEWLFTQTDCALWQAISLSLVSVCLHLYCSLLKKVESPLPPRALPFSPQRRRRRLHFLSFSLRFFIFLCLATCKFTRSLFRRTFCDLSFSVFVFSATTFFPLCLSPIHNTLLVILARSRILYVSC